jgi:hypothetical protein
MNKMTYITITIIFSILALTVFAQSKGAAVMTGSAQYDFIIADVDAHEVVRYSKKGERQWVYSEVRAIDVWPLPKDEVLIAYLPSPKTSDKGGVRIVNKEKKIVMDFQIDDEVMSCLLLPNGNILFTETKAGKLTEIDFTGKIIRSFDVKSKGMGHKTVRFIRMTPENTILAAECYSHVVREYSLEGQFMREFNLNMAYCAYRLKNGNTLISGYNPPQIAEIDPKGEVTWELSPSDLPDDLGLVNLCEVHRLPNGNTLVSNCVRESGTNKTVLLEITPDKKLVWQLQDSNHIKGITAVKPIWSERVYKN